MLEEIFKERLPAKSMEQKINDKYHTEQANKVRVQASHYKNKQRNAQASFKRRVLPETDEKV